MYPSQRPQVPPQSVRSVRTEQYLPQYVPLPAGAGGGVGGKVAGVGAGAKGGGLPVVHMYPSQRPQVPPQSVRSVRTEQYLPQYVPLPAGAGVGTGNGWG